MLKEFFLLDGAENFIPDSVFDDFIDLCKRNDAVVMGRKTYDAMQKYPKDLLDKLETLSVKKIVVSTRDTPPKIIAHISCPHASFMAWV